MGDGAVGGRILWWELIWYQKEYCSLLSPGNIENEKCIYQVYIYASQCVIHVCTTIILVIERYVVTEHIRLVSVQVFVRT